VPSKTHARLTRHMITSIALLDIIHALGTRALFRELVNRQATCLFLSFLVSCLAAGRAVLELFTRLALVPCFLVEYAGFVSAGGAREDVTIHAVQVYLSKVAGAAPSEVGCLLSVRDSNDLYNLETRRRTVFVESGSGNECVVLLEYFCGCVLLYLMVRQCCPALAYRAFGFSPAAILELCGDPRLVASCACLGTMRAVGKGREVGDGRRIATDCAVSVGYKPSLALLVLNLL